MASDFDQDNLVGIFLAEAADGLTVLSQALHPSDESVPTPQILQEQYIVAHRIRGAAALYGYGGIAQLCERLETLLEQALSIPDIEWPRAVGAMREIVQGAQELEALIRRGGAEDGAVVERCLRASEGLVPTGAEELPSEQDAPSVTVEYIVPALDAEMLAYFIPEAEEYLDRIDAVVQLLRMTASDPDTLYRLFRAAHTLKGSAYTIGFQVIGDLAGPIEDCIAAVREGRLQLDSRLSAAIMEASSLMRLILQQDPNHLHRLRYGIPEAISAFCGLRDGDAGDDSAERSIGSTQPAAAIEPEQPNEPGPIALSEPEPDIVLPAAPIVQPEPDQNLFAVEQVSATVEDEQPIRLPDNFMATTSESGISSWTIPVVEREPEAVTPVVEQAPILADALPPIEPYENVRTSPSEPDIVPVAMSESVTLSDVAPPAIETQRDPADYNPAVAPAPAVLSYAESAVQPEPQMAMSPVASPVADQGDKGLPVQLPDSYLVPQLDPEVLSYFAPEAQEYLEVLESNLLRLDKDPQNKELIDQLFRTAHTLKGSAYTVGFQAIGDLVHHVEDFMSAVRDNRLRVLPGHTDQMLRSVDVVRVLMRRDPSLLAGTRQRFEMSLLELKRLEQGGPVEPPAADHSAGAALSHGSQQVEPIEEQDQAKSSDGKSAEDREFIRVSRDRLERLLNLVGELVIGRGRLQQRLQVLERLSQQVLTSKTRLVDTVQTFETKHAFTFQSPTSHTALPAVPWSAGVNEFGSLELDKYDDFNILARRVGEVTSDISESMSQLRGSIRRAHDDMNQLQQLTLGMRDEIARARMVPIGTPFTRFRRAIREMARASNKDVTLITSGEHTEVDTNIVERLVDPLIHLVRNAVYHGIEPAADRVANGKTATGTVYLHAAHRGNSIIIEVEDDGAGLDLNKIRAKAVRMGLVREDHIDAVPDAEALKFIFAPGFSTADKVGDQAGRGVGLDVVKRTIDGMNGHIDVETVAGVGTKFTLDLPLTLLIATALLVRAGEERYAIPLPNIREVTMPTSSSLQHTGDRAVLHMDGEAIGVQSLCRLLSREVGGVEKTMPIVIVRTAAGLLGLAVDELLGRQEIVIKTLGSLKPLERSFFGGATIDPEGRVILVIDPGRLMARESKGLASLLGPSETSFLTDGPVAAEEAEASSSGSAILLVDDSLSIRKFVGRMLESAGYLVDTAVDGEDGVKKASETNYKLIITDLEMPKLNGFEVIQALRSRPQTQQTPVVVMTTRAGDKHRQLAASIGANAYIAKPVEERALLQEVERWVGQAKTVRK
jgi:chemosensory pili system protein ChpA (sensor histidine kinase/response regulator)